MKLLLNIHRQNHSKLDDKEQELFHYWLEEIDQKIFAFKHSLHNVLQENRDANLRNCLQSSDIGRSK